MTAGKGRGERQDNRRRTGANSWRFARGVRCAALLALIAAALTTAVSAQAATGGAPSAFGGAAAAGQDVAFTPMRTAGATWYGPGLYGRQTACGQVLRPNTVGVAHRSLPCGTTVKFAYHGHYLITQVIDRGPYTRGNAWDLTNGARMALGFNGSGQVHYAVAITYARH